MKQGYLFRMPVILKKELTSRADSMGISLSSLMIQILWDYVNAQEVLPRNMDALDENKG